MAVVMRGGNSGSPGKDYLPNVPDSGHSQPIQNTETSGAIESTVHAAGGPTGVNFPNPICATQDSRPSMPTGATNGSGTDIEDPDTPNSQASPGDIFKGSHSNG